MSYSRRKIYSELREITAANVRDEVNTAYAVHCQNQSEPPTEKGGGVCGDLDVE